MNIVSKKKYYTEDEYFALEEKSAYKSEYYDGEIFPLFSRKHHDNLTAMAGGSPSHSKISVN